MRSHDDGERMHPMDEPSTRNLGEPIDISPIVSTPDSDDALQVAIEIDEACRQFGFFSIVGHGVDHSLRDQLMSTAQDFFDLDSDEKSKVAMSQGGRAWRGWFPPGDELTSGRPDAKEGIYFGVEIPADDERVLNGRMLHGPNLWPERPAGLRPIVEAWMVEMERVARAVLGAVAVGIGLDRRWFDTNIAVDPIMLFRMFHYLPVPSGSTEWGVGEHTDYGLLTLLVQDDVGGLEVEVDGRWHLVDRKSIV